MKNILCLLMGYLLGSVNPAAMISKVKKDDLRKKGTGNLGASNTMLVFGKKLGVLVMIFDIAKAWCASKLAQMLFPQLRMIGLTAGFGAVLGHVFPFYMGFRGGKGLAAFAGMVLAYDSRMFFALLIFGVILMIIVNYSAVVPISAGILFPVLTLLRSCDLGAFLVALAAGVLIIVKHSGNLVKGRKGEDIDIRDFIKKEILHRSHTRS